MALNETLQGLLTELYKELENRSAEAITEEGLAKRVTKYSTDRVRCKDLARLFSEKVNPSQPGCITHQEFMRFFTRVADEVGGSRLDTEGTGLRELGLLLGVWPLDPALEEKLKKAFFYLEAASSGGVTIESLIAAVAGLDSALTAERRCEEIIFELMPAYVDGQALQLSEWLRFWAVVSLRHSILTSVEDVDRVRHICTKRSSAA